MATEQPKGPAPIALPEDVDIAWIEAALASSDVCGGRRVRKRRGDDCHGSSGWLLRVAGLRWPRPRPEYTVAPRAVRGFLAGSRGVARFDR